MQKIKCPSCKHRIADAKKNCSIKTSITTQGDLSIKCKKCKTVVSIKLNSLA